mgnify:CR=1 FL=1
MTYLLSIITFLPAVAALVLALIQKLADKPLKIIAKRLKKTMNLPATT